jgi:ketosteroid isomerase-like protein
VKKLSSYVRYGKSEYRYSDTYAEWKRAKIDGKGPRAAEADAKHRAQFGYGRHCDGWKVGRPDLGQDT